MPPQLGGWLAAGALLLLAAGPAGAQSAGDALAALAAPDGAAGALAGGVGRNAVLVFLGLTVLSLAPGIAIMVTCFPFIVTVLSILRQAIGLPQSPPNMLIVALSLMLTWYVMDPVLRSAWEIAGRPLQAGEITLSEAFARGQVPFRGFMAARVDPGTYDTLAEVAPGSLRPRADAGVSGAAEPGPDGPADALGFAPPAAGTLPLPPASDAGAPSEAAAETGRDRSPAGTDRPFGDVAAEALARTAPLAVLVPAFMLSEVQRAFEVGFLVALPFLIIDLVVSAVLMSMGMMMVPPAVVSLPFKLAFFVVVDGWGMIAGALVRGYG